MIIQIGQQKINLNVNMNHDGFCEIEYIFISQTSGIEKVSMITPSDNIKVGIGECISVLEQHKSAVNIKQIGRSSLLVTSLIQDKESSLHTVSMGIML